MAEIFGTTGNDLFFGTPEDDKIDALEGNYDVVSGLDGDDTKFILQRNSQININPM